MTTERLEPARNMLVTASSGPEHGVPYLLLHDRYGDYQDVLDIGAKLGAGARVVAVRSARTQRAGNDIRGYFWFLGPVDEPELTSVGDGLAQLEALLLSISDSRRKLNLIGLGEGGVMALLISLVWPELIDRVVAVDASLPRNLARLPLETPRLDGLTVRLCGPAGPHFDDTVTTLAERGAVVELSTSARD